MSTRDSEHERGRDHERGRERGRELRVVGELALESVAKHEPATKLDTLEDILHWGGHVLEVIVQDEYNHDVIVQGHADGFLVFDTT